MVDARHMPGHLDAGEQQVLSSPDVVESFARLTWLPICVTENVTEF
jgi:hypothetical protein